MNRWQRPSWLIVVFPAVMVAIFTFGYFRRTRELQRLRLTVSEFSPADNLELQVKTTREKAEQLRKEWKEHEGTRVSLVKRWGDLGMQATRAVDRLGVLDAVTRTLIRNRLHLVEKEKARNEGAEMGSPYQQLIQRLQQPIEVTFPEIRSTLVSTDDNLRSEANSRRNVSAPSSRDAWELTCVGTYADIQRTIRELVEIDDAVTPLRVEMEPAELDTDLRRWKLVLTF